MKKICIFVFSCLFSFFLSACGEEDEAADVAYSWVQALYQADVDQALKLIDFSYDSTLDDAVDKKKKISGKLSKILPEQKAKIDKVAGGVKSIEVMDIVEDKDNIKIHIAHVKVTFYKEFNSSLTKIENVRLIKIHKKWKVCL